MVEEYLENTPLGRAGAPQDVADAVVFLCSPKASWLTGEVLDLNGGAHLRRYPDVLSHVMKLAGQQ
ncbi:7-alpha-hydroxysteroid dehydrogenase [Mycobacterium talmoniae]|uniref:Peroxisomal trans-2-enoyl-CoA reductase n=1 Tax=Mycobacterium talmoniae TaxID=1858794 RepID=A0A2S8BQ52_9MYCO|nr:7-alpha-hydroxysteroid dehydrogenase [Mycobacterium talmoniae]